MCNEFFEVVVFTASTKLYADVVLDHIDPERKLIQHRLYRDSCITTRDNVCIKDLRIFANRDLKDLVIVDNAVYSFGAQLSNGVPICPFKDDKEDKEFLYLMHYLEKMKDYDDMRELNKETFRMEDVARFDLGPCMHLYNMDECTAISDDEYSDTQSNADEESKSISEFTHNIAVDMENDLTPTTRAREQHLPHSAHRLSLNSHGSPLLNLNSST